MTKTKQPQAAPPDADFKELINLLSILTEGCNQLAACQNQANEQMLEILDDLKPDYAALQATITQTEAALETLALRHPEWFTEKRTIKTAFGTVSLRSSPPHLVVPNEELTVVLIENGIKDGTLSELLLRTRKEPNLEALSELSDAALQALRIKRVQDHTFSAKPATLDLGKAVKKHAEATTETV